MSFVPSYRGPLMQIQMMLKAVSRGPIKITRIYYASGLSTAASTRILDLLVEQGLVDKTKPVKRGRRRGDARTKYVYQASSEGIQLLSELNEALRTLGWDEFLEV